MKSYPRSLYLSAFTVFFAACAFGGSITYSATQVMTPTGYNSFTLSGINDSGQVAGSGSPTGGGAVQAFIFSTTGDLPVASPDGSGGTAVEINNGGELVGYFGSSTVQGFIGDGTSSTAIPLPSGVTGNSNAYGINNSNQIAGYANTGQGFTGDTSSTTLVPAPAGFGGDDLFAINDSGYVTGYGGNSSGNSQAFIGIGGSSPGNTAVPFATGFTTSRSYAINNNNQIAGYGKNASNQNQVYIGTTSGSTAIPFVTGATSATVTYGAINDAGDVVGTSAQGGWVWDGTQTTLLSSIVPTGWTITSAISINNEGVILARGNESGVGNGLYLELTPITGTPEPGTTGLMIAGGLLCLGVVRRRKTR